MDKFTKQMVLGNMLASDFFRDRRVTVEAQLRAMTMTASQHQMGISTANSISAEVAQLLIGLLTGAKNDVYTQMDKCMHSMFHSMFQWLPVFDLTCIDLFESDHHVQAFGRQSMSKSHLIPIAGRTVSLPLSAPNTQNEHQLSCPVSMCTIR